MVIELGGHDFLNDNTRAETKANLKTIIDASRKMGAEVVLMDIPRAFISDPFWGLEGESRGKKTSSRSPTRRCGPFFFTARYFRPAVWRGEPYLTDERETPDPNAAGNEILADSVAAAL